MKTWADMDRRERDIALAQMLGYTVYHYDKAPAANCYYLLMEEDGNPAVRSDERKTEAEAWDDAPFFTTDLHAMAEVEREIARRKLVHLYMRALCNETRVDGRVSSWRLTTASAAKRATAAWVALCVSTGTEGPLSS
jgi:hypothetical protein